MILSDYSIQTRDDRQVQKIEFAKIVLSHKKELFGDGEDGMGNSRCNGETKEEVWKKIEAEVQHLPIYKGIFDVENFLRWEQCF